MRTATEFKDYQHWIGLYRKHLDRYPRPKPDKPCTVEAMKSWLNKLEMDEIYEDMHGSLESFIELNPDWPLFAWLGLCLEDVDYGFVK
mgnify:CR=1 FL=1